MMKSKVQRFESIGVIGLGIMGSAMASHLVTAGYRVAGSGRTTPPAAMVVIDHGDQELRRWVAVR